MRENGELDTVVWSKIKEDMGSIKKNEVQPKEFPAKQEEIKYPEHALKIGNPLYNTSNMSYGAFVPSKMDMPTKFFPRPPEFTATFLAGKYVDNGLITVQTPSRVHASLD